MAINLPCNAIGNLKRMIMESWEVINQRYLRSLLDRLLDAIKHHTGQGTETPLSEPEFDQTNPPAIENLCHLFHLSDFERKLVLLTAGVQLDKAFGDICSKMRREKSKPWVSFDLALQLFNRNNWAPFNTQSTLRYWQIIVPDDLKNPTVCPIHLDQSILNYLIGHPVSDPHHEPYLLPLPKADKLIGSYKALSDYLVSTLNHFSSEANKPVFLLNGKEPEAKTIVTRHAVSSIGLQLYRFDVEMLSRDTKELHALYKRMERDAILYNCAFLFDGEIDGHHPERMKPLLYLLKRLSAPCFVSVDGSLTGLHREIIKVEIHRPKYDEQKHLWQAAIPNADKELTGQLPRLLDQFDLGERQIINIGNQFQTERQLKKEDDFSKLWSLCRKQSRHKLKNLAQVIEPAPETVNWETLVLGEEQLQILHSIVDQVKQRHRVYQEWGFAEKSAFGLGISALFAGVSGTGKTLAARVMASELDLDIYHIDLSAIVSKYIGETEKNLEQIFSTAENSGAILLFDEADALFGKRSQVNDSKDRYANMEVSYLLQRMESYKGLSVLTTNYKNNMDDAFVRRLRFIVQFPFPQAIERAGIWRSVFPSETPINGLDYEKLSRLEIPGGIIRSIAVNAAFHAASEDRHLEMKHILKAAKEEYNKSEKTLMPELVADW